MVRRVCLWDPLLCIWLGRHFFIRGRPEHCRDGVSGAGGNTLCRVARPGIQGVSRVPLKELHVLGLARLGVQVPRAEGPWREQVRVAWTPRAGRVRFSASLSRPVRQRDEELGTLGRGTDGVGPGGRAGGWNTPVPTSQQLRGVGAAPQDGLNSQGPLSASTLGAEKWQQQRRLGNKKRERERCKRGGSEVWTGLEVGRPGARQRPRGQGWGPCGQWVPLPVVAGLHPRQGWAERDPGEASVHPDTGASALEGALHWGRRTGPGR